MKREIEFLDFVYSDLDIATDWYAQISFDLAEALYKEYVIKIEELISNPLHYQTRYGKIRLVHLNQFPYSIHFYLLNNKIIIIGFIHQHRNPKISSKRTIP